ncbi:MAG: hypothetical protein WCF23_02980 [Candidatus Nitrosopolaris sp.]
MKIQKKVIGYPNIEIGQEMTQGKKVMFSEPIEFEFITKGFVLSTKTNRHSQIYK